MKGLRVLLGGEYAFSCGHIRRALQEKGHSVAAAVSTGDEAVAQAKATRPDLAILDVSLPHLSGLDACHIISRELGIPTILIGPDTDDALREEACASGAMAYVLKPVENLLSAALEFIVCRFREMETLRQEVVGLKEALEARKLIERAKGILMTKLGIREADAYGILQKYSRDRNRKLKDVAQNIVAANAVGTSGGGPILEPAVAG